MEAREIAIKWIHKLLELETGEELFLHVHSKQDQKNQLKLYKKELDILEKINPVAASSVHIYPIYKDKRFWVVLRKVATSPMIAFKKDSEGNIQRVVLDEHSDELRRLKLMRKDGMTWQEIEELDGAIQPGVKREVDDG